MSEVDSFEHFVITRYFVRLNEKTNDHDAKLRASSEWLENRLELFKKFCLPSVTAQSIKNFRWLIYLDEDVPVDYMAKMKDLTSMHKNIEIITCRLFNKELIVSSVKSYLDTNTKWVLTTRLDNDDGWHRDFVKILHSQLQFEHREFLNFPVGVIYYADCTYLYRHPSNAFISFLERSDNFLTVWCGPHPYLHRIAPIRQLPTFPAFLQAIHRQTLSNKPRGVRVHRILALNGFEAMTQLFEKPTNEMDLSIVLDNMTSVAKWAARDRAVALARSMARKIVTSGAGGARFAKLVRPLTGD
jgi:hypothetical protein